MGGYSALSKWTVPLLLHIKKGVML
jgi:hypothetical protein